MFFSFLQKQCPVTVTNTGTQLHSWWFFNRKAFSICMRIMVVWELPTQTHLVVGLAFSHYVCHCHFTINMTTGISNLKLRQTYIQNIDASLHEQRNKKKTDQLKCLNVELLAMWWKPMWLINNDRSIFYYRGEDADADICHKNLKSVH